MKSFVIGTVLEPETREVAGGKSVRVFGLLSGRSSVEYSVFNDDRAYDTACVLSDGDLVCLIINSALDRNERTIRHYVQQIGLVSPDLQKSLQDIFK